MQDVQWFLSMKYSSNSFGSLCVFLRILILTGWLKDHQSNKKHDRLVWVSSTIVVGFTILKGIFLIEQITRFPILLFISHWGAVYFRFSAESSAKSEWPLWQVFITIWSDVVKRCPISAERNFEMLSSTKGSNTARILLFFSYRGNVVQVMLLSRCWSGICFFETDLKKSFRSFW